MAAEEARKPRGAKVGREDGWIIFHQEISRDKLEFKIAVDPVERCVLGMTYYTAPTAKTTGGRISRE